MSWVDRFCGKTLADFAQHCECHETFASTEAGDCHRVGRHEDGRRCLTVDEMLGDKRGFWLDGRGYWHIGERRPSYWAGRPTAASRVKDSSDRQGVGGPQCHSGSPGGPRALRGAER